MLQLPEEIPYNSGNRNSGFIYEDKVILYVAASLSRDDSVRDFWLVSNPIGIDSFDDVVLRISLKNGDEIALFVQVKLTDKPLILVRSKGTKIRGMSIKLSEYKKHADHVMDLKNCNGSLFCDVLKDVDPNKYFFCIFSNTKEVLPNLLVKEIGDHPIHFMDASKNNKSLQFDHTSQEYQHYFYQQLHILISQPNIANLDSQVASILGKYFTPIRIVELGRRIEKYMIKCNNSMLKALTKNTFELMSLEVLLDNWVLTDIPQIDEIAEDYTELWKDIFSTEHVINFHNVDKVLPLLGYLFQEQIREKIDQTFSWQAGITDNIKSEVEKKYQKSVTDRKDLMFLMWQEEHLPLVVKPECTQEFLAVLNSYHHLKKRFIIFSDTDVNIHFQDDTKVVNSVLQLSNLRSKITKILDIEVSLQGRPAVPLYNIAFLTLKPDTKLIQKYGGILLKITMTRLLCWTANITDSNQRYNIVGQELKKPGNDYIFRTLKTEDKSSLEMTEQLQLMLTDRNEIFLKFLPYFLFTIASEPGMGKSELLQSLAYNYIPENLVVYVNLRDCDDDFAGDDEQIVSDPVKYFFSKTNQRSDDLMNSIFEAHKANSGLALFIDGFDEILPEYRNKIKSWIEIIMRDTKIQIFVATRTHAANELPRTRSTISLNLLPFSNDDVIQYCTVREISTDILARFDHSILNNPLQLNMITSLYKDQVMVNNTCRADIYKTFIEQKHSLYYQKEKINRNTAKAMISEIFKEYHHKLALVDIFGEEFAISRGLIHAEELDKSLNFIKKQNLGLASKANSKPYIQFVHKTFAEYLVADWLLENKKNVDKFASVYLTIKNNSHYRRIYCTFNEISTVSSLTAHKAVIMDDTDMLVKLLNCLHSSIFKEDEFGRNIAHILAWYGQFSDVHNTLYKQLIGSHIASLYLCREDAILKSNNKYFESSSNHTTDVSNNNFELLKHVDGSDISKTCEYFITHPDVLCEPIGTIAMHTAIIKGDNDMVQQFLTLNMNLLQTDVNGNNALHISCAFGHVNITKLLLAKFCKMQNVNNSNTKGDTALHLAARHGTLCIDTLSSIKEPEVGNKANHEATSEKYLQIVKLLLDNGANPHDLNCDGNNALHFAAQSGNLKILEEVLDKQVCPSKPNNSGLTPLFFAASLGHQEVTQKLVNIEIDVNKKSNTGCTALIEASIAGHYKIIKFLMNNGADPKTSNIHGWTCLHFMASQGNLEIVEMLVLNGSDVNKQSKDKCTPLTLASRSGHSHIAEYLLNNGADPNRADKNGWNCLHFAAERGYFEIVQLSVKKGVNIDHKNNDGNTALALAARRGTISVVDVLLNNGCDFTASDKYGFNALHIAACRGHLEITKLLVNKGIDVHKKCNYGLTAQVLAYMDGHTEIVWYLLQQGGDISDDRWSNLIRASVVESSDLCKLIRKAHGIEQNINYVNALEELKTNMYVNDMMRLRLNEDEFENSLDSVPEYLRHLNSLMTKSHSVIKLMREHGDWATEHLNVESQILDYATKDGHLEIVKLLVEEGVDVNIEFKEVTPLNRACAFGHLNVVEFLLNSGGDPLRSDTYGWMSLHVAAKKGYLDIVKLLLTKGIDVNHRTKVGATAIGLASSSGHLNIVEYIMESGGDPLLSTNDGCFPLHFAANGGYVDIVEFLLTNGTDVHQQTNDGITAMCVACASGHLKVVKCLLNVDRNTLKSDYKGSTPLHIAAIRGYLDIVKLLLIEGIDVNHRTDDGLTALSVASINGNLDVVKFLLNINGDILQSDDKGWTCLHFAARHGHLDIVQLLVTKGIDVNHRTNNGRTAINLACTSGHLHIVEFLFQIDRSLLKPDIKGYTLLHAAAVFGHLDIVKLLLTEGIDINHRPNDGVTAMYMASMAGHLHVVEFLFNVDRNILESKDNETTPLHIAASAGHLDVVKFFLTHGIDVNHRTNEGLTAMSFSSQYGHLHVTEFLLNVGGDPSQSDNNGWTSMHCAANKGYLDIVKLLSTKGHDVNAVSNDGATAISLASEYGHLHVVEFLLSVGGDPSRSDRIGWSAMHYAARKGYLDIVELFLKTGIDVNQEANDGATAMILAVAYGHKDILDAIFIHSLQQWCANDGV